MNSSPCGNDEKYFTVVLPSHPFRLCGEIVF
jgi:hypothetical protein